MAVTPPKPHDDLTAAAGLLARQAPNAWDNFVAVFEKYTGHRVGVCASAPPDKIFQAQGAAMLCNELHTLFESATVKAKVQAK